MSVTISVPRNRLKPIFFCGLRTSPAMNVTLFQASLLNIDPTIEAAMAPMSTVPLIDCQPEATGAALSPVDCTELRPVAQFSSQEFSLTSNAANLLRPNRGIRFAEVTVV